MKMSGPNGVIDVIGDIEKAIECKDDNAEVAECVIAQEELEKMTLSINPLDDTLLKRPTRDSASASSFETAKDTMNIDLIQGNSKEQVIISKNLSST
jgi:hypothetical protein